RDGVRRPSIHIDAQSRPQKSRRILGIVLRITSAAPVPKRDVKVPVRPEDDLACVVIAVGLCDLEDDLLARTQGAVRILRIHVVSCDDGAQRPRCRVIDKERTVLSKVWMEGEPEQPRSEEHTSELQSRENLVCRLLLEKKKNIVA